MAILLMVITSFRPASAQGSWEEAESPTTVTLRSVCFVDSLYGWIAGDSGTIIRTTDGGQSWSFQETGFDHQVMSIFFLDSNRGWASAFNFTEIPYGTLLLNTVDGGENWNIQPYPQENIFMNCILFLDSLNGWMGGSPHALVRTNDGGQTWQQAAMDTTVLAFFPVLRIQFYNEQYGYACGGMFDIAGVIWWTHNGGEMWYPIDVAYAPADEVRQLHLFDSLNLMASGGDPDFGYGVAMMRSSDGGVTWYYEELGMPGNAYDLDFRTDYEAWAPLGPRRKFIYSLDTGLTWTDIPTLHDASIYEVTFPDSLHGWAIGANGAILKYKPPFTDGIGEQRMNPGDDDIRLRIFPNPFRERTTVEFELEGPAGNDVTLYVTDVLGRALWSRSERNLPPGLNSLELDLSGLPDGVHYLMMNGKGSSGHSTLTGKVKIIILE